MSKPAAGPLHVQRGARPFEHSGGGTELEFSAKVTNQGKGVAGASVLRIVGVGDFKIGALAANASQTVIWNTCVAPVQATADVLDQVKESDEGNNSRKYDTVC